MLPKVTCLNVFRKGLMQWVAAAVATAVSNVVVACELIRPQALVRRTGAPQPDTGPFPAISIEEDYALILKSNPDGGQGSLGRMCLPHPIRSGETRPPATLRPRRAGQSS
jgi:hypothetical protein